MASSDRARAIAERDTRKRDVLFAQSARDAVAQTRRLRMALIQDFTRHGSAAVQVATHAAAIRPQLARFMLLSDLTARLQAMRTAKVRAPEPMAFDRLTQPYEIAIDKLRNQLELNAADVAALAKHYDAATAQTLKTFSDGLRSKLGQVSQEVLARGLPTQSAVPIIRDALDNLGLNPASPRLIETVYRTQGAVAYGSGQWDANQSDAIMGVLWGYEYVTVGDDRVRANHAAMDGTRYPKNHPFWRTAWPPCGWNCRCAVIEIFAGDPLATEQPPAVGGEPDPGWGFNAGMLLGSLVSV